MDFILLFYNYSVRDMFNKSTEIGVFYSIFVYFISFFTIFGLILIVEILPLIGIHVYLFEESIKKLSFNMLWLYLTILTFFLSIVYAFKINYFFNTNWFLTGYIPVSILTPFVLKKLGWNLVDKVIK
jgi:hypothetical protein